MIYHALYRHAPFHNTCGPEIMDTKRDQLTAFRNFGLSSLVGCNELLGLSYSGFCEGKMRLGHLSLQCLDTDPAKRPTMPQIVRSLEEIAAALDCPAPAAAAEPASTASDLGLSTAAAAATRREVDDAAIASLLNLDLDLGFDFHACAPASSSQPDFPEPSSSPLLSAGNDKQASSQLAGIPAWIPSDGSSDADLADRPASPAKPWTPAAAADGGG